MSLFSLKDFLRFPFQKVEAFFRFLFGLFTLFVVLRKIGGDVAETFRAGFQLLILFLHALHMLLVGRMGGEKTAPAGIRAVVEHAEKT